MFVAAGLAVVAVRVGTGPILDAVAGLTIPVLLIALGLGAVATAASALRWRAVGRALGVEVPAAAAWAGVYRATLLNSVLPGGLLGDVDRALGAYQRARDEHENPQRAARVVVLERSAGQATVFVAAVVVAATIPTLLPTLLPVPTALTATGVAGVGLGVVAPLMVSNRARATVSAWIGPVRRQASALGAELRGGLLRPRTTVVVVASSLVGFASLVGTFALAAEVVGAPAPLSQLLPLCTVGLVAMAVPVNLGGWGPREAATAAAFATTGLGAPTGLAVAVLYGVLSLVGCLPGAVVLALEGRAARRAAGRVEVPPVARSASYLAGTGSG